MTDYSRSYFLHLGGRAMLAGAVLSEQFVADPHL